MSVVILTKPKNQYTLNLQYYSEKYSELGTQMPTCTTHLIHWVCLIRSPVGSCCSNWASIKWDDFYTSSTIDYMKITNRSS